MTYPIKNVVNRLSNWHRRRVSIRELSALDDRLLKDIGISRSEIGAVVDGALRDHAPAKHRNTRPVAALQVTPQRAANDDGAAIAA